MVTATWALWAMVRVGPGDPPGPFGCPDGLVRAAPWAGLVPVEDRSTQEEQSSPFNVTVAPSMETEGTPARHSGDSGSLQQVRSNATVWRTGGVS